MTDILVRHVKRMQNTRWDGMGYLLNGGREGGHEEVVGMKWKRQ